MVVNAYKTQTGTLDKAIVKLLIVNFSGQLKRWWDYHFNATQHLKLLIVNFSGQLKRWWDYHFNATQHLEILNSV